MPRSGVHAPADSESASDSAAMRIRFAQAGRLKEARIKAGFRTAREFADKRGFNYVTYSMHEAASRGIKAPVADDYARALNNCSAEWIITGTGRGPEEKEPSMNDKNSLSPQPLKRASMALFERVATGGAEPAFPNLPRDVPVFGTAAGSSGPGAFVINTGNALDWATRMPGIAMRRGVYALYVENDSMEPRYYAGEMVYVDPQRPAAVGDFIIIQCRKGEHAPLEAYIKRLKRRTAEWLVVEQFNPHAEIKIAMKYVAAVHRVLYTHELA